MPALKSTQAMTAKDIIRRMCRDMFSSSFVMPNYTPAGWFECDLFEITNHGFFREHEVKVSRADFLKDREKGGRAWRWDKHARDVVKDGATKHELLSMGNMRGPCEFWFVTTPDLVGKHELPPWAGLRYARAGGSGLYLDTIVQAPRVHNQKADPKLRAHAQGTAYWRMHRLIQKVGEL